jgi:hypothetical protein
VEASKKGTLEAVLGKETNIGNIDVSVEEEDIEVVRSVFPLVDKCDLGLTRWHVYSSLK